MKPNLAIAGVGRMGANMARRLAECGYPITAVYDILPEPAEALAAELGCTAARQPSELVAAAGVILTVVTDDAAMRSLFFDPDTGLLCGAKERVFINCATVSPGIHVEIEQAAGLAGASSLEACMASSITQAREGTLYLMCGGRRGVFDGVRPILDAMASEVRYIGDAGQAARLKALVNMVMNCNTAALAEGLGLADALGLDLDMVREVFAGTGAASRVLQTDGGDMQHRDHACFFSAAHAAKDSGIALALAREAGLELPLAAAAAEQYRRMVRAGLGDLDKSGIAELTFRGRGPERPA